MVKDRHLILTALEETWPSADKPVVFLGEWCKIFNRKKEWSQFQSETVGYHWDDREKMYSDYLYITNLYEIVLKALAEKLNEIHSVNHSLRYWRILIGPWLGYFIQITFDRFEMIRKAEEKFGSFETRIDSTQIRNLIPNDMNDFVKYFDKDSWNFAIFSSVIKNRNSSNIRYNDEPLNAPYMQVVDRKISLVSKIKSKVSDILNNISGLFVSDKEYFFISTYIPLKKLFGFQIKLGQLPRFWKLIPTPAESIRLESRNWDFDIKVTSEFEKVIKSIIPFQLPRVYLEGYQKLCVQLSEVRWPKNPGVIFTSNSHNSDDFFKAYAAQNIEKGSVLVIGQHGGHFGIGKWSFLEEHETTIPDKYLTWGWSNSDKKVQSNYSITIVGKKDVKWNPKGKVLLVTCAMPRYSCWLYSSVSSSQWLYYLNDQFLFTENLNQAVRETLTVRLYSHDYEWNQKERWNLEMPDISLDLGSTSMENLMINSRIYVSSYNATTFLESMGRNMPTIMFWNPKYWELRDSAIPFFEKLEKVGIFHRTPDSAAKKINDIWDDVESWWNSEETQNVKNEFCFQYARKVDNPWETLSRALVKN